MRVDPAAGQTSELPSEVPHLPAAPAPTNGHLPAGLAVVDADATPRPSRSPWLPRFVNRELSWLEFNRRVLTEATDARHPLLERARFLSIFESNLDEFYMVRVSGLIEQVESGVIELSLDGLSPSEQLRAIATAAAPMRQTAGDCWEKTLRPALAERGVRLLEWAELVDDERATLETYFRREVFPVCTPLVMHPADSFPFISNRSLNLAVVLLDDTGAQRIARVKIPTVLPRLVPLPRDGRCFILLEKVITQCLQQLFPGVTIVSAATFRVIRDADVEIRELEAGDLMDKIEETIRLRRFGDPVLLEASADMTDDVRTTLARLLGLDDTNVFRIDGLLGLEALGELASIPEPALRFPPHQPVVPDTFTSTQKLFETIRDGDLLLHHPFDSFRPVETFIASAANDPDVIGIKQTLYRVGAESPLVESLLASAEVDKQVAVLVELKARFDESNNLGWARALERAGVHVVYGFAELKTHAKLCVIVRREGEGLRTYAHVGTGNYNPSTARVYTDVGLLTCDPEITQDALELFNVLTGHSKQRRYRRLLVAPYTMRDEIVRRIWREATHAGDGRRGRIIFKLNALADPAIIDALYAAAQNGVQIDLIVRGICCLRPNVEGLSQGIRVRSVVGRFLEHSRLLYFENGGEPELFIGSADLMPRNLDRRIEVMAPVLNPERRRHLYEQVLLPYLHDTRNSWDMGADGVYRRVTPLEDTDPTDVHASLLSQAWQRPARASSDR